MEVDGSLLRCEGGLADAQPSAKAPEMLRVLHLFAGKRRVGDLASCVRSSLKGAKVGLDLRELDVLRGKKSQNLLSSRLQEKLLNQVKASRYEVVVASPPCSSFSRVRSANREGPPPLRSQRYPFGYPWLKGKAKHEVRNANKLVDFTVRILQSQLEAGLKVVLEHPEDLGRRRNNARPASIWQWPKVKSLASSSSVVWGALYQSDFGSQFLKPTRILSNLLGIENILKVGPPAFDMHGSYVGPLMFQPPQTQSMVGKDNVSFLTKGTEAWPRQLCQAIASCMTKGIAGELVNKCPKVRVEDPQQVPEPDGRDAPPMILDAPPKILLVSSRRKATDLEIRKVRQGIPLIERGHELLYVGRTKDNLGKASRWANPFRIGVDGSRAGVLNLYKKHLKKSGLEEEIGCLQGKTLLCHCGPSEDCHADILLQLLKDKPLVDEKVATDPGAVEKTKTAKGFNLIKDNVRGNIDGADVMLEYIDDGLPSRMVQEVDTERPAKDLPHEDATCRGGHGPPRTAHFMGKDRPYEDGGGKCSPGRWPREQRLPTSDLAKELLIQARALMVKSIRKTSGGKDSPVTMMLKLAAGHYKESPFDAESIDEMTQVIVKLLGVDEGRKVIDKSQSFRLPLISDLMKALGDPDWHYYEQIREGVPLGVNTTLPRTPAVFDEKCSWPLEEMANPESGEAQNYKSIIGHEKQVRELFEAEAKQGWMVEMSDFEAEQKFGKDLFIAALAVVAEPDKIRVVHDGTNKVHVNNCIRVRDQCRSPTAGELRSLMREKYVRHGGNKRFILVGDVSKAHRRVKVRSCDWGFQACRLEPGKLWVNTVGTYGVSSAGYWWSRLSSGLLVRLFYYVLTQAGEQDTLLYADDIFMDAGRTQEIVDLGAMLLLWCALGTPWKWSKFRGGCTCSWIGYWLNFETYELGISEARASWIVKWAEKVISEGYVDMADFRAVLGRLCFTVGALDFLKPFLSPLFAWSSQINHLGRVLVPWSVAFLLSYLASELRTSRRCTMVRPRQLSLGTVFRADAKAEGQSVVIGGWECREGTPPRLARWYAVKLDRGNAPWAFSRGEPFRTIAAIELFASLVSLMAFTDGEAGEENGTLHLSGFTDNAGNTSALTKLMSSKFPLIIVLTELAAQMQMRNMELDLTWVPRNQNEEADGLTNGIFEPFDMSKRVNIEIEKLPFKILKEMTAVANDLYERVRCARSGDKKHIEPAVAAAKGRPLRERDPWGQ